MADQLEVDPHSVQAALRQRQLLGVVVDPEGNYIDHIYREPSNMVTSSIPPQPVPDRVFKERYVSDFVDGRSFLKLQEVIEGTHIPGFFTPESFEFPR